MAGIEAVIMRDCSEMVLSRDEARYYGFKVYRTGKACKRGHLGYRWTAAGGCVECIREIGRCVSCLDGPGEKCPVPGKDRDKGGKSCAQWRGV